MAVLDQELVRWVVEAVGGGAAVVGVRGLREGSSPWMLALEQDGVTRNVVLRAGHPGGPSPLRTEQLALQLATAHGLPVPGFIAGDLERDPPLLLVEAIEGESLIPVKRWPPRLHMLGAAAFRIHSIAVPPLSVLPLRASPLAEVDFSVLRREQPRRALLAEAEAEVVKIQPRSTEGLVHGDLWQGNTMWSGGELTGLLDWDSAGKGPAGIDLGSLRCDAAMSFGLDAAEDVLRGWEDAAGHRATDVAYWDVIAALSTPPNMGSPPGTAWFVESYADQGRPDLNQPVLLARRDEFLAAALKAMRDRSTSSD